MLDFKMPDVGEGISEGEIVRWLVAEGERVEEDAALVEVQTDKAVVQIPAPAAGNLLRQGAPEGGVIKVGETLAVIGEAGEEASAAAAPPAAAPAARPAETPSAAAPAARSADTPPAGEPPAAAAGAVKATPAVRQMARQAGVDLSRVAGSGPGGRITHEDVERAAASRAAPSAAAEGAAVAPAPAPAAASAAASPPPPPPAPVVEPSAEDTVVPLRGLRRTIAQHMARSMATAVHVTTMDRAEVTALTAMRDRLRPLAAERQVHLTYLPFVVKAAVTALRQFPYVNASLDDEGQRILLHHAYHVGIATATEDGLMVPVVRHADRKSVLEIGAEVQALAARARARASGLEELRGSTFTITNIGSAGGLSATPVINHPEVAILGMYRAAAEPVVRDGRVVPGLVMNLTLTFDHRVIDGETGARFLRRVAELLESPERLSLEMP